MLFSSKNLLQYTSKKSKNRLSTVISFKVCFYQCDVSTIRCVNAGCLHQKLLQNNLILLTQTNTSIRGNNSIMLKTSCYHAGVNTNTSNKPLWFLGLPNRYLFQFAMLARSSEKISLIYFFFTFVLNNYFCRLNLCRRG